MRGEKARAALNAVQAEMVKACGDNFSLAVTDEGEPGCLPKPPKSDKPAPTKADPVEAKK